MYTLKHFQNLNPLISTKSSWNLASTGREKTIQGRAISLMKLRWQPRFEFASSDVYRRRALFKGSFQRFCVTGPFTTTIKSMSCLNYNALSQLWHRIFLALSARQFSSCFSRWGTNIHDCRSCGYGSLIWYHPASSHHPRPDTTGKHPSSAPHRRTVVATQWRL